MEARKGLGAISTRDLHLEENLASRVMRLLAAIFVEGTYKSV